MSETGRGRLMPDQSDSTPRDVQMIARFLTNNGASIQREPITVATRLLRWLDTPVTDLHAAALELDMQKMELEGRVARLVDEIDGERGWRDEVADARTEITRLRENGVSLPAYRSLQAERDRLREENERMAQLLRDHFPELWEALRDA